MVGVAFGFRDIDFFDSSRLVVVSAKEKEMHSENRLEGRVIRVGRGWADVAVGRTVRRITTPPDLLLRVGNRIGVDRDGAATLRSVELTSTARVR